MAVSNPCSLRRLASYFRQLCHLLSMPPPSLHTHRDTNTLIHVHISTHTEHTDTHNTHTHARTALSLSLSLSHSGLFAATSKTGIRKWKVTINTDGFIHSNAPSKLKNIECALQTNGCEECMLGLD